MIDPDWNIYWWNGFGLGLAIGVICTVALLALIGFYLP